MYACMHAYMYACMHAYMYACMHTCMHVCIHVYMHACIHTYTEIEQRAIYKTAAYLKFKQSPHARNGCFPGGA